MNFRQLLKRVNKIILLLLFPVVLFGQDDYDSKKKLNEINSYVKHIDSIAKDLKEGIAEGPIVYHNIFRKNGGWEAYFINDENKKDLPLRIRYSSAEFDKFKELNLYYLSGKLVFADLTLSFRSGKRIRKTQYKKQFHFPEGRLRWESRTDHKEFKEADEYYSFEYLYGEEKFIRKMIYK